jgi:hypothetical protein
MSMFQVTGQVLHVYQDPDRTDKETGEVTKGRPKVQILGELPLENGQTKHDMITLSVDRKADYDALVGQRIAVPLGMFSPTKGQIAYFIPKGGKPSVVASTGILNPLERPK